MPDEIERRIDTATVLAQIELKLDSDIEMTREIRNAVMGHNGTPGLVAKQLRDEDRINKLQKFKWYDRGLSIVSGVVGGFLASMGLK